MKQSDDEGGEEVSNGDNNEHADNCINNNKDNDIEGEDKECDDKNSEHNSDNDNNNDNEFNIACLKQRTSSLHQTTTHSNNNNKHNRLNSQPNDIIPQTVLSELKPRISYLHSKLKQTNITNDIITAVRSNLFSSLRNLRKDVYTSNLHINPTTTSLNVVPANPRDTFPSSPKPDVPTLHIINTLKNDAKSLKSNIHSLNHNESLLKNESFLSLNPSSSQPSFSVDKALLKVKLSHISEVKDKMNKRLYEVSSQIDKLLYQENKKNGVNRSLTNEKLQQFLNNLSQDNLPYNKKLSQLHKESELRRLTMQKEINSKIALKQQALMLQDKLNEDAKREMLNRKRIEEKERINERTRHNKELLLKVKPFIHCKCNSSNKYSYIDNEAHYVENESELVRKENMKRKAKMKCIDVNEFKEFEMKVNEMKYKAQEESLMKMKMLKNMWNERSKLKPMFVPTVYHKVEEDVNIKQSESYNKQQRAKMQRELKMEYSLNNVPMPRIRNNDDNDSNVNTNVNVNKVITKSHSLKTIINKKYQHYLNPIREVKRYDSTNVAPYNNNNNKNILSFSLQNTNENNNNNIKKFIIERLKKYKPRIKSLSTSKNTKVNSVRKYVDYLTEERIKKEQRRVYGGIKGEYKEIERNNGVQKDIKKIFEQGKGMLDENLYLARNRLSCLEEQAKQKEKLLKIKGGIVTNPELGNEVCDLMIGAIKAKLSILGEINEVNGNEG